MADIDIRIEGRAGRITLTRERALNALSYRMCLDVSAALAAWRDDPQVALVVIDAAGERAFCAGGDIQEMYETGRQGDFGYGQRFWADEYRMNDAIAEYPKPVVSLMQGYTMGGGVGLGCHASIRVVCETSRIAMPEVAIGLVPDVGGTGLLARAPGHLGEYLGATAARMGPDDAIYAGFADHFVPREFWLDLLAGLVEHGDAGLAAGMAQALPPGPMAAAAAEIDAVFSAPPGAFDAGLAASGIVFGLSVISLPALPTWTGVAAAWLLPMRRASPITVFST